MAVEIVVSPEPDDSTQSAVFYGSAGGDRQFEIGQGVSYKGRRGLTLERGALLYSPDRYTQYGQWAQLIDCTAYCESKRVFVCLNTYDPARFTFGCLQFGAHVPDGYFVKWLQKLLQRGEASDYFPDLLLVDGRIFQVRDGGNLPLEDAGSTSGLMDYLNSDPLRVDQAETTAAARLIYWTMTQPATQDAQIEIGYSFFEATVSSRARQLALDGRPDFIVAAVMDILHQERGRISDIEEALAASSVEVQLDRLLNIGSSGYASRCSDLRSIISTKRKSGELGKQVYRISVNGFQMAVKPAASHLAMAKLQFDLSDFAPPPPGRTPSVANALERMARRSGGEAFEGVRLPDGNLPGNVLLVTSGSEFHSFAPDDILDEETVDGGTSRLWVRRGARAWRSVAVQVGDGVQMRPTLVGMEDQRPPPMEHVPDAPAPAGPSHKLALVSLSLPSQTIAGAAAAYQGSCLGGDHYDNNCAHFLSDGFLRAGFDELAPGGSASRFVSPGGRCDTPAKRVIRARDMWAWFKSKATQTATSLEKNTGMWAVFQLDESAYWGGHVVIIDTENWTYYGTGNYPKWTQYAYKW